MSEPQYGKGECHDCHVILPKPEMTAGTIEQRTPGATRTHYTPDNRKAGVTHESATVVHVPIWRCKDCHQKHLIELERIAESEADQLQQWTIVGGLCAGIFVICLILVSVGNSRRTAHPRSDTVGSVFPQADESTLRPVVTQKTLPPQFPFYTPANEAPDDLPPRQITPPKPRPVHASSQADATDCDRLAASHYDHAKHHNVHGVTWTELSSNSSEAISACEDALNAHPHVPRFRYQLARAIQTVRPNDAVEHLEPLLEQNYAAAFDNYGWLTIGLHNDPGTAQRYFRRGAELGNADAMHSLAELILKGHVKGAYRGEGIDLMNEASRQGHASASSFVAAYESRLGAKEASEEIVRGILGGLLGNATR